MAPSSNYIIEVRIDVLKALKIFGLTATALTAVGLGAYYINQR
ncbi:unnamed protein product, partial [Rotaria sp. Silwood1]